MDKLKNPKVALVVLDGWGIRKERQYNAIAQANTPHWDALVATYGQSLLTASGEPVGLPRGQMGNSEVGHMHIGSGQVIPQDLLRINEALKNGDLARRVMRLIETKKPKKVHLMGLYSGGGVHAHAAHWHAVMAAIPASITVDCHVFTDGRDTPPTSARGALMQLQKQCKQHPNCSIASIAGRYYAMDRDQRWERTNQWMDMLSMPATLQSAIKYIDDMYAKNITDEFLIPAKLNHSTIEHDDLVIIMNFRADRVKQLLSQFTDYPNVVTMTAYSDREALFAKLVPDASLGYVFADAGLSQVRIAETEKFAHVTYFLNGGHDACFPGEKRVLVPSPKVASYEHCPEMAAGSVTKHIEAAMAEGMNAIFANYANADMVGHTGDFAATIKAIECLDECIGQLTKAAKQYGYRLAFCADHGNAEWMWRPEQNEVVTSHTCSSVPFVMNVKQPKKLRGTLIDIAPTILDGFGLAVPKSWQGKSLLLHK